MRLVAYGGFTNPTLFVIAAFDPDFWSKIKWKVFSAVTVVITSVGLMTICYPLIYHALWVTLKTNNGDFCTH